MPFRPEAAHLVAVILILASAGPALAQAANPDDVLTIKKRTVSDESFRGLKAGTFLISPGIELKTAYDDNLFRTEDDKSTDLVTEVNPAIAVQSDWKRHAVFLGLAGDFGVYKNNDSENFSDFGGLLSGDYDIAEKTWLTAAVSRRQRHEGRGSLLHNNNRRLDYTDTTEFLGFTRELSYIHLNVEGTLEDVSLEDDSDPTLAGIDDYTKRGNKNFKTTVAYEYMPENEAFLTAVYDTTDYTMTTGGNRDSDGVDARAGVKFDNARTLSGSAYAGYIHRDFDAGSGDTDEPYLGGALNWKVKPLTTVSFFLDRVFQDTTAAESAGVVRTIRKMTARHSFTNRIDGEATAGVDDYDYVGGTPGVDRDTRLYYGGFSGAYELKPGLKLKAGYDHQQRDSSDLLNEFQDNRVLISLIYME